MPFQEPSIGKSFVIFFYFVSLLNFRKFDFFLETIFPIFFTPTIFHLLLYNPDIFIY